MKKTQFFLNTLYVFGIVYWVFIKKCSYSRIWPFCPRQYWAAIGCTENGQPIVVTVQSHCAEDFENLLQRCVGEGWLAVDCEKTHFFLNILYVCTMIFLEMEQTLRHIS